MALALLSCAPVSDGERPGAESADEPYLVREGELVDRDGDEPPLVTLGSLPLAHYRSTVIDMSDDGSIIVGDGTFDGGRLGFRWTEQGGMQSIPKSTRTIGISPRGRLILGIEKSRTNTPWDNYVLWDDIGRPPRIVVPVDHEPTYETQYELVEPLLVLDDGTLYGWCLLYSNIDGPGGCRVDPAGHPLQLWISTVRVADRAGHYGGGLDGNRYDPRNERPMLNGDLLGYIDSCDYVSDCEAEIRDFSAGAKVAVGTGIRHMFIREGGEVVGERFVHAAFVHTANAPMRSLPDLPGERENAGAYAVSDDGAVIGGWGHDTKGQHAVVWIDRQPHRLVDLVVAAGGRVPAGYRPFEVRAMSADGRVFAGNGVHADGRREAFRAVLPRMP